MSAKDVEAVTGSFPMIIQTDLNGARHIIHTPEALPVGHAFKVLVTSPLTLEKVVRAFNKLEQDFRNSKGKLWKNQDSGISDTFLILMKVLLRHHNYTGKDVDLNFEPVKSARALARKVYTDDPKKGEKQYHDKAANFFRIKFGSFEEYKTACRNKTISNELANDWAILHAADKQYEEDKK